MSKPIQPDIPEGSVRYFTNARGANLTIPLRSVWEKNGYVPVISPGVYDALTGVGPVSYDPSSIFLGTNKTAQWWYYNDEDAEFALSNLRKLGMNCVRVFLDYYLWEIQGEDHLDKVRSFLKLCDKYKIRCQFVLWEQFNIAEIGNFETSSRDDVFSSVIPNHLGGYPGLGGGAVWGNVPLLFETSSSARALDFFSGTGRGKEYIDALVSSTSSYQSMWSFDVQNESGGAANLRYLSSATSTYVKNTYPFIKTTFGHGAGFEPTRYYQYVDSNGASGTNAAFYQYSGTIDFASMHAYSNSNYFSKKYLRDGVSGTADTGLPAMFNEASNYPSLELIRDVVKRYFKESNFGGMFYQAFCERTGSCNPFNYTQGLLFDDGECRQIEDASAFVSQARDQNWFSRRQLANTFKEKKPSVNGGLDGGFTSGTATGLGGVFENYKILDEHSSYRPNYSGISEEDWIKNRDSYYGVVRIGGIPVYAASLGLASNYNAFLARNSYKYPDRQGTQHSNVLLSSDPNRIKYNLNGTSGFTMNDVEDSLYTLSSLPDLSSFTSDQLSERNDQVLFMSNVIMMTMYTLFPASGIHATPDVMFESQLGTQWDDLSGVNEVMSPEIRRELSGLYQGLGGVGGTNTIMPAVNTRDSFTYKNVGIVDSDVSSFSCHTNGLCFYTGGTPPTEPTMSDIDWDAYTNFYNNLISKLVECVTILNNYADNVDPDFRSF